MLTVKRLDFAFIDCDESVLFRGGDKEKKQPIGCFAWLIQDANGYTLIDTGIEDMDAVNATKRGTGRWVRADKGMPLTDHLARLGLAPADVKKVVITHAHYDHISGVTALPDATVYITKAAFLSLQSPDNPFAVQLQSAAAFMKAKAEKGQVVFTDDGYAVSEHITTVFCEGHIAGGQMVAYRSENGNFLFTGDEVFLRYNVENALPIGLSFNAENAEKAVRFCCDFDGEILTGHDLVCLEEYDV